MAAEDQQQAPTPVATRSSILMEISNVMVRLYKEYFGRGPTQVRTQ